MASLKTSNLTLCTLCDVTHKAVNLSLSKKGKPQHIVVSLLIINSFISGYYPPETGTIIDFTE